MNIAVVDIAASEGGALAVLYDFCDALRKSEKANNCWYIITSTVDIEENEFIHNVKYPEIKKSWIKRFLWEKKTFPKLMKKLKIDIVFSLQNNAMPAGQYRQIIYFHNVLLLQKIGTFLDSKIYNAGLAVRTNLLGPYTRYTWSNADKIIVQGNHVKKMVSAYYNASDIEVIRTQVEYPGEMENSAQKIVGYIYPTSAYSYKNIEVIIEAEKKLNRLGKRIDVLITIDGDENGYARKMVALAKKVEGIHFIGYQKRDKLFELYKRYGVIITSRYESFCVPIVEAMMAGTVIVGFELPYFAELTNHYSRVYSTSDNDKLSNLMINGLKDTASGNYSNKNIDGWKRIIELIQQV